GVFGVSGYVFFYAAHGPGKVGADLSHGERQTTADYRLLNARAVSHHAPGLSFLYYVAVGTALFACVDFYFQFPAPAGFGPQFIWLPSGVFRRAQGVFYEASTLGNLCAFFLEMIAVLLFRPRDEQPLRRLAILAGGALLAAALALSYSRASLINLTDALMVLLWLHRKRIRWALLLPEVATFVIGAT